MKLVNSSELPTQKWHFPANFYTLASPISTGTLYLRGKKEGHFSIPVHGLKTFRGLLQIYALLFLQKSHAAIFNHIKNNPYKISSRLNKRKKQTFFLLICVCLSPERTPPRIESEHSLPWLPKGCALQDSEV